MIQKDTFKIILPKKIPIEATFNDFVKKIGGIVISKLFTKTPNFFNADYFFEKDEIVAELKCLEKDYFNDIKLKDKIKKLYDQWYSEGLVPLLPSNKPTLINSHSLPIRCQLELINIFKRKLEESIKKANRQIRETKKYLGASNAKGLLLLANDGNLSLELEKILYLLSVILKHNYKSINSLVYFTVNMTASVPDIKEESLFWIPLERETQPAISSEFIERLFKQWKNYHQSILDMNINTYVISDPSVDFIEKCLFSPLIKTERTNVASRFKTKLKPNTFYRNLQLGFSYFCEKIENNIATFYLIKSYQCGVLTQALFTQSIEYSYQYIEITDNKEIDRLSKLLSKLTK